MTEVNLELHTPTALSKEAINSLSVEPQLVCWKQACRRALGPVLCRRFASTSTLRKLLGKAHGEEHTRISICQRPFSVWLSCVLQTEPVRKLERRWAPAERLGIFAGYVIKSGYRWRDEYLVWDLSNVIKADRRIILAKASQGINKPHASKTCMLAEGKLAFTLKEYYERVNRELRDPSVIVEMDNALDMLNVPFLVLEED
jgi:hypothetical protein